MIKLSLNKIKTTTFVLLSIPIVLFLFGWVKLILALPLSLMLVAAVYLVTKGYNTTVNISESRDMTISRSGFVFLVALTLVWVFLAGQGGFFFQTDDHQQRNALFRDLINFPWPVHYAQSDTTLVYYITYWLIPAGIGKITLVLFGVDAAWLVGNITLFFWTATLVFLTFLLLVSKAKTVTLFHVALVAIIFILFSGLDAVGFHVIRDGQPKPKELEWWTHYYQYSSNTTQLLWVFNQSVPAWLLMLLLMDEKTVQNYAYLGFLIFAYSPFPFIGALPFLLAFTISFGARSFKAKNLPLFWKQLFSFQNIFAVLLIFPVFALYFSSNSAMSDGTSNHLIAWYIGQDYSTLPYCIFVFLLFCLVEFGLYVIIIASHNKKNLWFWVSFLSLCFIAMFRIANRVDFAMRASIPALLVLCVLVIEYINYHALRPQKSVVKPRALSKQNFSLLALSIMLILGGFTPADEYSHAFGAVIENHKINLVADDIKTFSVRDLDDPDQAYFNFLSNNFEDHFFGKYLAK